MCHMATLTTWQLHNITYTQCAHFIIKESKAFVGLNTTFPFSGCCDSISSTAGVCEALRET